MNATETNDTMHNRVLQEVASRYGKTVEEIKGNERIHARARQLAIYILKEELGQKLKPIVALFGIKSDSQVYVSAAKIKELLRVNKSLATQVEEIKAAILIDFVEQAQGEPGLTPLEARATLPHASNSGEVKRITGVIEAVAAICLGPHLLVSKEPSEAVLMAQRLAMYIAWEDCGVPLEEIAKSFNIELKDIYLSIGRVVVDMKRDKTTSETLAKIRSRENKK